ncbi:Oxidoreductase molybdopterin binding domain protein [Marinomonas aquimarina]|uniref:Oxidoreductase molybdopterin binding domain protein n=1 Tax=Marinomonas aquimarina TaxID=295068 RepID=A0A1A8TEK7_9GAMM|nr:molybdopterin-dependent oxidoreductase [Marinomonas aquimarina]SBS31375.1 Oxidoreductase molybdopterin binding domain protein [Marinomonas aquimarina]
MKQLLGAKICALTLGAMLLSPVTFALEAPTGRVILTVSGNITETNSAQGAQFDRDMLLALGVDEMVTETPWTEGINTFSGPRLSALLSAVGAAATSNLSVTALNDYSANVPAKDAYDHNIMLAMDMNGDRMSVRDKGPIFVLYPFAEDPSLNNEVIHNRSVWQVKSITVE